MELNSPDGDSYDTPVDARCPLCRNEQTTLKENSAGKPYFQCQTHKVAVNLNGGETSEHFAAQHVLSEPDEPEPTEESDDSHKGEHSQTLADILGGEDDE